LARLGAVRPTDQRIGQRFNRPPGTLGTGARREIWIGRFYRRRGQGHWSHLQRPSQVYASRVRARCPETANTPEPMAASIRLFGAAFTPELISLFRGTQKVLPSCSFGSK